MLRWLDVLTGDTLCVQRKSDLGRTWQVQCGAVACSSRVSWGFRVLVPELWPHQELPLVSQNLLLQPQVMFFRSVCLPFVLCYKTNTISILKYPNSIKVLKGKPHRSQQQDCCFSDDIGNSCVLWHFFSKKKKKRERKHKEKKKRLPSSHHLETTVSDLWVNLRLAWSCQLLPCGSSWF